MPTTLPESGRAAVVAGWGEPLALREYPVSPPPPGALLVAVERTTICGSDVHAWEGAYAEHFGVEPPIMLGHEIVGRVVAFGDGPRMDSVGTPLAEGDRVVWEHEACGHCYFCSVERNASLCESRRIGFLVSTDAAPHFHGGFGDYSYVWPRSGRLRVPDEVDSALAAAASCALRSAIPAVTRLGPVDFTDTVVVQGTGPLGLFATALFSTHSPRRLIVIGAPEERLAVARAWGADVTISIDDCPGREERLERVLAETDGRGASVVGEFSGGRDAVAEGVDLVAPNGRYVVAGSLGGPDQSVTAQKIALKNLTIVGSLGAEIDSYYKALEFLRLQRERFGWDLLLGSSFGLGEATSALQKMQAFEEIKPVLDPGA
jgi:threonine dehydrogenase-like Zn-dependent dehydrogenase